MRYLNKIILIASANVKYTDINLDGNVHFIGTQGVGKSTLLRVLLFFYNANPQKLGIPVGKKSFPDFYFPYPNSYIIYEVARETGAFCILLFKSQGRVCFRFIDGSFNREHYIDSSGNIVENWDKIKLAFGKDISYTRKIDSYEEYRNILYGNSQGLGAEFKKYSLLDSKQYQNIPRAIQHVFLNAKVESNFIKDTIIKSLHEDEVKITLLSYAHHLKDFETQLNDIKKWTEKTKGGEIIVRKQADTVIETYSAIRYIENEKQKLAAELAWQLNNIQKQEPKLNESLRKETEKHLSVSDKLKQLDAQFQQKKDKLIAEISVFDNKLKEAKTKATAYAALKIEEVIKRVSKKPEWETERDNLRQQKELLESNFADIKQKFEAQINQLTNQLAAFKNLKQTEINIANTALLKFKEELGSEYEKLYAEIAEHYREKLQLAKNHADEKKKAIHTLDIQKVKTENQRFYEKEIETLNTDLRDINDKIRVAGNENTRLNQEIETIKTQWELEKEKIELALAREKEKINEKIDTLTGKINAINEKIENSKDSLYGWLNHTYPGWEKTIGKVIDEDTVLFQSGLSPVQTSTADLSFYGIKIDLEEISKSVKTVADYENEKAEHGEKIQALQNEMAANEEQLTTSLENLKKKYQPKINAHKETIRANTYTVEQNKRKLDEATVSLQEYKAKASADKKAALEKIEHDTITARAESQDAANAVKHVEAEVNTQKDARKKEKDKKNETEQKRVNDLMVEINTSIATKEKETKKQTEDIQAQQKKELDAKGADTHKIQQLEKRIDELKIELEFIEANRDKVSDYHKDKRELFDKVDGFQYEKTAIEQQLHNQQTKYNQQKQKYIDDITLLNTEIEHINKELAHINEDLNAYETFKLTGAFSNVAEYINISAEARNDKRCTVLIAELNEKYTSGLTKYTELQQAIHKFNGNFSSQNIFKFKQNLIDQTDFFQFAKDLQEFVEEDKISMFEKRVNELFADIIKQVGNEITELLSKEGEIEKIVTAINNDFKARIFTGVIKSIELRVVMSENRIIHLLTEIKKFNDENLNNIGLPNLFSASEQTRDAKNKTAIQLLSQLTHEISKYKHPDINLSDTFELQFKVIENDNDTNWVQSLTNVGSNGTDVLVKAMINIMLLNVFKEGATKKRSSDFRLHCMVDEIGTLHIENVRGLLKFANDRNIYVLNGSPESLDALAYKHTYKLAKITDPGDGKPVTVITRLITNKRERA